MKISLSRPNPTEVQAYLPSLDTLVFSYEAVGKVTALDFPVGYDHDRNEALIGQGKEAFTIAKSAIQSYGHFPSRWAFAQANGLPYPGQDVGVFFHQFGLWWWNGSRVVEVIDEPNYYGFSYGTLANHVEKGEEIFYTRMDETERVFYGIHAFSWPRFWGARMLKYYARVQQARFVRDSIRQMKTLVANA